MAAYSRNLVGDAAKFLPDNLQSFYYLRHGQTDWNRDKLTQGTIDIPLNKRGIEQARTIRPLVTSLPIKKIVTSPLKRASETARLSTDGLNLPLEEDARLVERHYGDFEGTVPPPNFYGEDFPTVQPLAEFATIIAKATEHCCTPGTLIVGHGGWIKTLMAIIGTDVKSGQTVSNCCLMVFDKRVHGWEVTVLQAHEPTDEVSNDTNPAWN